MCSEECRLDKFKLVHPRGEDFASSLWFPLPLVIAYRIIISLYCWIWIVYNIFTFSLAANTAKWLIYLTNWTFTCVASYFTLASVVSVIYYIHLRKVRRTQSSEPAVCVSSEGAGSSAGTLGTTFYDSQEALLSENQQIGVEENMPGQSDQSAVTNVSDANNHFNCNREGIAQTWYHALLWIFYIIAADNSPVVTVIYWTVLFPPGGPIVETDIAFHLLNSVFMVIETCVSAIPVHLFHIVYAFLYGITYVLFTVVYWLCGGTDVSGKNYIYPVLKYEENPRQAALYIVGCGLIGLPVAQLFVFGLFKLRCYIYSFRQTTSRYL